MKFEKYNIAAPIKKSLNKMGYKRPTDIQFKSIPNILKREDVLAIAQTGTGKTAAFAIPIIDLLHKRRMEKRREGIKCVVMAPTHELALQITEVFQKIAKYTKVIPYCIIGGVEQAPQIERLQKGVDILIATPGRLFDLRSQGYINLDRLEILVLDEADHMLDLGFIDDINALMRYLPKQRQTLFFSATINPIIKKLAYSIVRNPIRIQISPKDPVARNIDHAVAFIEMDDKRFFLERLVSENPKSKILVFVRTKIRAERVSKAMARVNIESKTIHSDKNHSNRLKVLEEFKRGKLLMLIATDVSARGIDIPNVDYVVNYDLPEQSENYVHRVGRTGRGKNRGNAVTFCSEHERLILEEIEGFLGKPIKVLDISEEDYIDTKDYSDDASKNLKNLMQEIQAHEKKKAKKKKRKYKKK